MPRHGTLVAGWRRTNACLRVCVCAQDWGRCLQVAFDEAARVVTEPPGPGAPTNVAANCLRMSFHDAGTYVALDEIFG